MNGINRLLHIPTALKQNAWKIPMSTASLALIATLSFSAISDKAIADEPAIEAKITETEKAKLDKTAAIMVRICDALVAGEITPEDAAKKMIAFTQEQARWDGIKHRIEGAVEAGKMTREEADAKYAELSKGKPKEDKQGSARAEAYLKEVSAKLKAAVENGEITEAQAKERMEGAKKRIAKRMGGKKNKTNARAEAYLKKVGEEIRTAVANGEMTAEEGKAKYTAAVERIKKRMAAAGKRGEESDAWEGFKRRIEAAVESGEMTPEESREAYEGFRRRMAARGGEGRGAGGDRREISDDCMALRIRLGTAVRNGEMTREEAGKIWEEEGC